MISEYSKASALISLKRQLKSSETGTYAPVSPSLSAIKAKQGMLEIWKDYTNQLSQQIDELIASKEADLNFFEERVNFFKVEWSHHEKYSPKWKPVRDIYNKICLNPSSDIRFKTVFEELHNFMTKFEKQSKQQRAVSESVRKEKQRKRNKEIQVQVMKLVEEKDEDASKLLRNVENGSSFIFNVEPIDGVLLDPQLLKELGNYV